MPDESRAQSAGKGGIRSSYKVVFYLLAWILALIATDPSLKYWALAYLFPLGLVAFVNLRLGNDGGWWALGGSTFIYLLHAVFYFRSKTAPATILLLAVLVVLLVCNVAGCRAQLPRH
jgi:hypothetical protein